MWFEEFLSKANTTLGHIDVVTFTYTRTHASTHSLQMWSDTSALKGFWPEWSDVQSWSEALLWRHRTLHWSTASELYITLHKNKNMRNVWRVSAIMSCQIHWMSTVFCSVNVLSKMLQCSVLLPVRRRGKGILRLGNIWLDKKLCPVKVRYFYFLLRGERL